MLNSMPFNKKLENLNTKSFSACQLFGFFYIRADTSNLPFSLLPYKNEDVSQTKVGINVEGLQHLKMLRVKLE
jgi:hypothetical protein